MQKDVDKTQIFTTFLAYSLPILQFFFSLLTGSAQQLFLFQAYFLVVSIFTAVISYVMITVLKARAWFEISPFQHSRKKKWREWQIYTNPSIYTNDEIKDYQSKNTPPAPIRLISPDNIIQTVFLPGLLLSFVTFLVLGLLCGRGQFLSLNHWQNVVMVVIQALAYGAFIVFAVLSFAHQYIRDSGKKLYDYARSHKYEKMIELARTRDVFGERKNISLITQWTAQPNDYNSHLAFILSVGDEIYVIVVDSDIDTIIVVKKFDELSLAENYVWGEPVQQVNNNEEMSA